MPFMPLVILHGSLFRRVPLLAKAHLRKRLLNLSLTQQISCTNHNVNQGLKFNKDDISCPSKEDHERETENPVQVYLVDSQRSNGEKFVSDTSIVHIASKGILAHFKKSIFHEAARPQKQRNNPSSKLVLDERALLRNIQTILAAYPKIAKIKLNSANEDESEIFKASSTAIAVTPDSLDWHQQGVDLKRLPHYYAKLAKIRLTGLVVITTIGGYVLAPALLDPFVLISCAVGTALTSSGANTFNQFLEIPYDSQMNRTKDRVLVRGLLTPLHCAVFGTVCFASGVSLLYFGVNEITAALGALNFFLYTCAYTPLKRMSIINTWIGAFVGAIPPLMGWAACTGNIEIGGLLVAAILYAWQFPHFNSLSWNLRPDYSRAGYRMMSVTDPALCRRTALRYCASIVILSLMAPVCDVTTWTFAVDSLPLNLYFTYLAWKFHKEADSNSSRKLFRFSLLHLPALIILMMISKKHSNKNTSPSPVEETS